ncbi:MAG: 2,3,4,5-tetrahydropyridine-2,6-dicarboxylate N-succinyltransferase [SAR86 cluster bacterium]|uniref:2,3,4,5-tetrahydropyridine-2,6-dicarboxylate N-succinyltransferase n=1 Tax=SAR86 cluster bacterium TaxID=2030880 RepID=A0A2A4X144_9GAMM|nr:MAG: 2,3,4,5-tetrahydropyridine-2,6-dicarboxylate N-succinyltransferase [SAR86 cluster bacterium]
MNDTAIHSLGLGLATRNTKQDIIEVFYPQPLRNPDAVLAGLLLASCAIQPGENAVTAIDEKSASALVAELLEAEFPEHAELVQRMNEGQGQLILCVLFADSAPKSVAEAYLKLHLLSHRLCKPHSLNLDGLFAVLHNLAWTNEGAIDLEELPIRQLAARLGGTTLEVASVDKFPKMTSYVVPAGVRIAHTARVRLGAYLGAGTTVMHEGFVNFNAGTEGPAMVEGRISAGVMIGANSDLGGGCSTMGTLSGGGTEVISVGENCLIGANAGIGIPLANGCTVEAGLYLTAGTKLNVLGQDGAVLKTVKAKELVGVEDLLFRRNSLSGGVECVPLKSSISLNDDLHSHN